MTTDGYSDLERALGALTVPEDLAQRHLARLAAAREPNVVPLRRPRRTALRATAAGTVLGAMLLSGAGVAAASTALPGDALYGLKSARERVQLSMTRHGESRARLELRLARTRLAEAAELLRQGDVQRAVATLARADAALASASAQGGAEVDKRVAEELDRRVVVLAGLLDGGLPSNAADAAREAVERALHRATPDTPRATPTPGAKPTDVPSAQPTSRPTVHPTGRPSQAPGHGVRPTRRPTPTQAPQQAPSRGRH